MQIDKRKKERIIFAVYMAGLACLLTTLALFQPLGNTYPERLNPPDEHARFLVPWYICQTGRIPTGFEEEVRIPAYGFSYAVYNAFPYIVQGAVMRLAHRFTDSKQILLYAGRFVNVGNGLLMAFVIYLLSKRLFRDSRFQWLYCFAVMYWPEVVFLHSYINTDSMCLLSTAIIVYALVCGYQEGFRRRDNVWLSVGIILCALSYYNAYGYILVSILLFAVYFAGGKKAGWDWRAMFQKGLFISALVLLGIGWWFIRSGILYDGDILGLKTSVEMQLQYAVEEVNPLTKATYYNSGKSIWEMFEEDHYFSCVFVSFVAAYGSVSICGNIWFYRLIKGIFFLAAAGCVWQLRFPDGEGLLTGEKPWRRTAFHVGMLLCILIPLGLLIGYSYFYDYQPQGRYVLICAAPLFYYVVRGFQRLAGSETKWIPRWLKNVGIFSVGAVIVIFSFAMVFLEALPRYLEMGMVLI